MKRAYLRMNISKFQQIILPSFFNFFGSKLFWMKRICLLGSFLFLLVNVNAIDIKPLISEANAHYAKNEFDNAILKYRQVIDSGHINSGLYFNLANAYYKTHNIKNAILYYERAKLLNPGDKDIDTNLELARSQTFDKIEAIPGVFFITWFKWLQNRLSKDTWALVSVISFILGLFLFLFYLLTTNLLVKKAAFWFGSGILILAVIAFVFGYQLNKLETTRDKAIIFSSTVIAKSSPSGTGTNLFIIHEGTKVEILDKIGNWNEIRISDGNRGWIKDTDMEVI